MFLRLSFLIGILLSVASSTLAGEIPSTQHSRGGIFVEGGIDLTSEDIAALKLILTEDEAPNLRYEVVSIKSVIDGYVYLMTARKPDYYGIKIVLSKEGSKWLVLKKVKSIY